MGGKYAGAPLALDFRYSVPMRLYFGSTASELATFITEGSIELSELYAATPQFIASNPDCDEEELEFILSLLAAEDALDFHREDPSMPLVIACEVSENNIATLEELSVSLIQALQWKDVEAVFTVGDETEDLTWFAPQEAEFQVSTWIK